MNKELKEEKKFSNLISNFFESIFFVYKLYVSYNYLPFPLFSHLYFSFLLLPLFSNSGIQRSNAGRFFPFLFSVIFLFFSATKMLLSIGLLALASLSTTQKKTKLVQNLIYFCFEREFNEKILSVFVVYLLVACINFFFRMLHNLQLSLQLFTVINSSLNFFSCFLCLQITLKSIFNFISLMRSRNVEGGGKYMREMIFLKRNVSYLLFANQKNSHKRKNEGQIFMLKLCN